MIGERWGVTDAEVARRYPCDEYVPQPALQAWRGVTVRARPEDVWPWVAQIRLAPYSYDWIDNLGRRSPRTLLGLPDPAPGEQFSTAATRPVGRTHSVEKDVQLTGTIAGVTITYALLPTADATRLIMKLAAPSRPLARVVAPLLSVGDLIMARRQLLNIKHLAEQSVRAH